ncbi:MULTISPECIES: murein hydrolase activator EnvC family protein [unclassified Paenibacillus]|uniref:murein hydrolase activator EnvC family protein n=1 Tax=unclassified Paenibacillus TaxID=185978 RepID=UPI002F408286
MKRLAAVLIAITLVVAFAVQLSQSEATSLSQIEKDIAAAKQKIKNAERKAAQAEKDAHYAESQKKNISAKKEDLQKEITKILSEIDKVGQEKIEMETKIEQKNEEVIATGVELEQAEERIVKRDELLQSRMRLMYTNGFVSYVDVLLSSTSFSDFLDRFDALQSILNQDRDILDEHKKDKELVVLKKKEVELQLLEVKELYYELEIKQADLIKKENEKETLIASYNSNLQELDEALEGFESITEEQEKLLVALAAEVSKLNTQKNKIKNPYTGGKLGMPIDSGYRVTSNFGTRIHPITKKKHTHTGIDFGAPSGTPIYAAESGVVIVSQWWGGYGNCVIIDHGNGLWTLYGHIRNGGLLVDKGDTVKKGQQIAEVGNTGNSTGPHLHFEVRKNEVAVNPGGYLK